MVLMGKFKHYVLTFVVLLLCVKYISPTFVDKLFKPSITKTNIGAFLNLVIICLLIGYYYWTELAEKNLCKISTLVNNVKLRQGFAPCGIIMGVHLLLLANLIYLSSKGVTWKYTYHEITKFNWSAVIYVVVVAVLAPIVEELLFRGVYLKEMLINGNKWRWIFVSACMFSLYHLPALGKMIITFILGLYLGLVFIHFRSLVFPVCVHAIHNIFVYISYHMKMIDFEGNVSVGVVKFLVSSLLLFGIGLIVFSVISWRGNQEARQST